MQINIVKIHYGDNISYKYKPFSYCCEALKENKTIILTDEDFVDNDLRNWYDDTPKFCCSTREQITSYEDSWDEVKNFPIQFCPHCGEKINISVVDEIDLSSTYNALKKEKEEAREKSYQTDSKKETSMLEARIRELDKKIRWYWALEEWKEKENE